MSTNWHHVTSGVIVVEPLRKSCQKNGHVEWSILVVAICRYPLVMTVTVRYWSHGPFVESSWSFSHCNGDFPVRYVNYQRVNHKSSSTGLLWSPIYWVVSPININQQRFFTVALFDHQALNCGDPGTNHYQLLPNPTNLTPGVDPVTLVVWSFLRVSHGRRNVEKPERWLTMESPGSFWWFWGIFLPPRISSKYDSKVPKKVRHVFSNEKDDVEAHNGSIPLGSRKQECPIYLGIYCIYIYNKI